MRLFRSLASNRVMLKDSSWVFGANLINIALGMGTTVVLTHTLAMEDVGKYQLLLAYVGMAQIATLPGMNVLINKAVMKGHDGLVWALAARGVAVSCLAAIAEMAVGAGALFLGHRPLG